VLASLSCLFCLISSSFLKQSTGAFIERDDRVQSCGMREFPLFDFFFECGKVSRVDTNHQNRNNLGSNKNLTCESSPPAGFFFWCLSLFFLPPPSSLLPPPKTCFLDYFFLENVLLCNDQFIINTLLLWLSRRDS
jgi:hypothetical protein